jgi:hypothetical protein
MYHQIKSDLESGRPKGGEKPVTAGANVFCIFVDSERLCYDGAERGALHHLRVLTSPYPAWPIFTWASGRVSE